MPNFFKLFFIYFSLFNSFKLICQLPQPCAILNHTQVYFEEQFVPTATRYQLIIYSDSTASAIISQKHNNIPAFWMNDFNWGCTYYWKIIAFGQNDSTIHLSAVNKFSIQKKITALYVIDTRLDIKTNAYEKDRGGYILLDHAHAIFDRQGKQVWSLPEKSSWFDERKLIRDMNLSPYNTITLLAGPVPVELDFEGRVLWEAPYPMILNNDTLTYHHDFKRHANGHYFVLANKKVYRQILGNYPDSLSQHESGIIKINDTLYKRTLHGLLLEFDEKGNLIWYWDSNTYISTTDLNYKKNKSGFPTFGTHMNAFSINSENTKAYLGFRDLNRIIKIDKKSKRVEFSYGEKYPSGEARIGHLLFRGQHDATLTNRKTLLIFNNNNSPQEGDGISSVIEIKENAKKEEDLLFWNFELNFDTLTNGKGMRAGNVHELPNKNLLVCGGVMPRIFEVTKSKKIVWDAFPFFKSSNDSSYAAFDQYRAHWTPQLFYYHFIATIHYIETKKGEKKVSIKIFNTGNAADSYKIYMIANNNQPVCLKNTNFLNANEQIEIKLKLDQSETAMPFQLKIISKSNHLLYKTLVIN